ncbi:MAG: membrane fusion protein (multidrug efflux system), partial [Saprospiraceae bacterium]
MIRKIILAVLGIALVLGAVQVSKKMIAEKQAPKPREKKVITAVFTETVTNSSTPISIKTSGNLMAKNRIELYAEVQGVFENTGRSFLPGEQYKNGATLIKINSEEHRANIRSQKSSLYNQIVNFLPDLKLDYEGSFASWEAYAKTFDVNASLSDFPEPVNEREKMFIAGKNILTAYYNIKNLEERLTKYTIKAPFYGILTEALVTRGAVVRAGQKLGEFISPAVYELEVGVNDAYTGLLQVGKKVSLHNTDHTKSWTGAVSRINGQVNPASQTIQVFIQVSGKDLREGMYLEAEVTAKEEKDTYEVNRKLLFDEDKLYVLRDSVLDIVQVNPVYFKEKTVVVK